MATCLEPLIDPVLQLFMSLHHRPCPLPLVECRQWEGHLVQCCIAVEDAGSDLRVTAEVAEEEEEEWAHFDEAIRLEHEAVLLEGLIMAAEGQVYLVVGHRTINRIVLCVNDPLPTTSLTMDG